MAKGLRVLVTSKSGSSLSVLRKRLPPAIQDLCVDISISESRGQQQLQQTEEKLSFMVSQEGHNQRCLELDKLSNEISSEISQIDKSLQSIALKQQNKLRNQMCKKVLENSLPSSF